MALTQEFLAEQKKRLQAEKERLEAELTPIAKKDPSLAGDYDATFPDFGRDMESNAQEEEQYETRLGVEQSLEVHLQDVNNALVQIEQGAYGLCSVCNSEIEHARLEAFPAATTCLKHSSRVKRA